MLNRDKLIRSVSSDLLDRGPIRPTTLRGLFRYYSPETPQYVARVQAWQRLMCLGYSTDDKNLPVMLLTEAAATIRRSGVTWLSDSFESIRDVHQVVNLFWKEQVPQQPDWQAFAAQVSGSGTPQLDQFQVAGLRKFVSELLGKAPTWDELEGVCGTGATAERASPTTRWDLISRPARVPHAFFRPCSFDTRPTIPTPFGVARAAAVPKNRKGCRYVASEPSAFMYAQLGIMSALDSRIRAHHYGRRMPIWDAIEHTSLLSAPNMATVDLKDASDRISCKLVRTIFPKDWFDMLTACRSSFVSLPDGNTVQLATFAPMGNGFCFRVLSIVVAACCHVAVDGPWSVFGDDIICHRRNVPSLTRILHACGLLINEQKTCVGRYIESCGVELLDGKCLTPFRPKSIHATKRGWVDPAAAAVAARSGLPFTAGCVRGSSPTRYNRYLQRSETRVPIRVRRVEEEIDGWPGINRWYSLNQRGSAKTWGTFGETSGLILQWRWLPSVALAEG